MRRSNLAIGSGSLLRLRTLIFLLPLATAIALGARAEDKKIGTGEFDCLIQPKMVLKLGTPVPGLLTEVLVDRGAVVKKGDVIAKLESGVEEAAAALAQARADNDSTIKSSRARRDFQLRKEERAKLLRRTDNIPLSAADEAEQSFGRPCRQSNGRNQADIRTHLIHRPARDILPPVDLRLPPDALILGALHAAAVSLVQWNSVPSIQMRCRITANRRAKATIAFFIPRRLAICMAQALSQDHFFERSMLCAAS